MKDILGLIVWLVATLAAGFVGSQFRPGAWYEGLAKPSWTPPDAVFAPVWTALYILMAIAAWLVWRKAGFAGAPAALGLFVVQLGLNALWSYLFFGLHRPDLALFDIALLWLAILATLLLFWKVQPLAGALLIPYLLWVTYASALNLQIWRLNP